MRASPPARAARKAIASSSASASSVSRRAAQHDLDVAGQQRAQLVDLAARQQRRVDLEVGVLGRGPDEGDEAFLDRRQQRVLLGLVEAVDLVEEEDRRLGQLAAVLCALEHLAHLRAPGLDGAQLLQGGVGRGGHDPRQRRLARARRPVEDHRVRPALLDGAAQRRALGEQVLLADELVERSRPQARGQRACQGIRDERLGPASSVSKSWLMPHILPRAAVERAHRGRRVAWGDGRRPRARDDRAAPAPRALQHGQPARQRAPGPGAARRPAARRGLRGGAARSHRGAPEPGGAPARRRRRADAVPALARRHRARRPGRVAARPVVGRRGRRRAVGPRRPGHEVPDGGRGDRRPGARAVGLAPGARRPARRLRGRRGDRRRRGRGVADREPPRRRALRPAAQRGRGRRLPLRRRARLRRVRGREGRLSLHGDAPRASPGTPRRRRWASTRC